MAWKRVVLCLAPLIVGSAVYAAVADIGLPIGKLEFAGDARTAAELTAGRVGEFRTAIAADYPFIVGYTATIVLACLMAWGRRPIAVAGCVLAVGAAACDVVENLAMRAGLSRMSDGSFERAAIAAGVKFALVGVAAVIAVTGLVAIARRPPAEGDSLT